MTPKQDIDLLVGVKGGGAVDGASGKLMASQINGIIEGLNSKGRISRHSIIVGVKKKASEEKIKETLKSVFEGINSGNGYSVQIGFSGKKKEATQSIKSLISEINLNNNFTIEISKFKITRNARTALKKDINSILQGLHVTGSSDTVNPIIGQVKSLETAARAVDKSLTDIANSPGAQQYTAKIKRLRAEYANWINDVDRVRSTGAWGDGEDFDSFNKRITKMLSKISEIQSLLKGSIKDAGIKAIDSTLSSNLKKILGSGIDDGVQDSVVVKYRKWASDVQKAFAKSGKVSADRMATLQAEGRAILEETNALINAEKKRIDLIKEAEKAKRSERDAESSAHVAKEKEAKQEQANLKKAIFLQQQMRKYLDANTKASNTKEYEAIEDLEGKLDKRIIAKDDFSSKELSEAEVEFKKLTSSIYNANKAGRTLGDSLTKMYTKFGGWMIVTRSLMAAARGFVSLLGYVKDVDSAMTELKKVTNETSDTYNKFLDNAAVRAKKYGATLADTVSSTADFSRLGYALPDAEAMANAAIVYKSVGDGIESISEASESIISTMQAFNEFAGKPMEIIDRYNEVGNNFAISSKGIGDAMMRSAAALASANNTIDESIALVTAANEVVQDPDKTGTTLKTISMFLRSSKTEAEEAGIETEGMVESVSKLREDLLGLTGGRVDIQIDDSTFKSTYQILKEISEVWDSLTDVTQANILEKLGGRICRDVQ